MVKDRGVEVLNEVRKAIYAKTNVVLVTKAGETLRIGTDDYWCTFYP